MILKKNWNILGVCMNITFKPHTGTKISVLFVQKWNDDPKASPICPNYSGR